MTDEPPQMKKDGKGRWTALRRGTRNRPPPAPRSPRAQSGAYLVAHACFACRKSFKIAPRPQASAICPGCRGPIFEMGRSFKAPGRRDIAQWAKVQALYEAGFRFFSYRSFHCPALPTRLSEVRDFIRDHPNHPMRVARPSGPLALLGVRTSAQRRWES